MTPISLEGQTLGKYRVLEPLGQGGMAQVFRAYHAQLDRYVAIKVLRPDLVEDQEFLARFSREARSVATLRHPNIVQVFDFDVQDGLYYMVMELLEGDTLKAYLNRYRGRDESVPPAEIVRILNDVLKGLAYAHNQGIIHRDIKPANILLTRQGEAVLTDFGIAQIVGGTKYTVQGALMGTLHYMAPEQGMGQKVDGRSDLYSLGVVLYEMLTGHPPFDADTPLAILMKHLNDPLPLPSEPGHILPKSFERVVLKALAKQPDDRYQNAAEMLQALEAALPENADASVEINDFADQAATQAPLVYSGKDRQSITDRQFAAEDTDMKLEQSLRGSQTGQAQQSPLNAAAGAAGAPSASGTLDEVVKAAGNLLTSVGGVVSVALNSAAQSAAGAAQSAAQNVKESASIMASSADAVVRASEPGTAQPYEPGQEEPAAEKPVAFQPAASQAEDIQQKGVAQAALTGVGLLVGTNLLGIALGTSFGWWGLFQYGWSAEILLVAILLLLLMGATANIFLLIPAGILLGNGVFLAFCSMTGLWRAWGFLWLLDLLVIGGSIFLPVTLARQAPDRGKALARALSTPLALLGGLAVVLVGLGSIITAALRSLFP